MPSWFGIPRCPVNPQEQHRYRVLKALSIEGGDNGACNAGIYLVQSNQSGRIYVEKRLKQRDVHDGHAGREVHALKQFRGQKNLCQIIHWELQPACIPRIYLEHYELGALDTLIERYKRRSMLLPQGFLYHTLGELSKALCFCVHGYLPGGAAPVVWNTIVHRDIKPGNVFLSTRGDGLYPRVVLGDFGCSVSERHIKEGIASPLVSRQAPAFAPPEAPSYSTRSDVFQVGLVLHCMARLIAVPDYHLVASHQAIGTSYPESLQGVVAEMLRRDRKFRPSSQDLPGKVARRTEAMLLRHRQEPLRPWAFR
ncbi:kinase-like protein [Lophium mytilinum]|uniref:non-specific serine/threonine protein kinase n=1 Tax=Lophium mytilinum TaxID=390894 RepID=A0A6A6QJ44_9PEZI|nr:kinase-like protein [Lophium mytilinum]